MANLLVLIAFRFNGIGYLVDEVFDDTLIKDDPAYDGLISGEPYGGNPRIEATTDAIFRPTIPAHIYPSGEGLGWGHYTDTQYTSGSPLSLVADTTYNMPNNKGTVIETDIPSDITTFYDGTTITGRDGDGILINVSLTVNPTILATYLEVWLDVGGGNPPLYINSFSFPRGAGVDHPINFTISGYTPEDWETNGGVIKLKSGSAATLFGVDYIISRPSRSWSP